MVIKQILNSASSDFKKIQALCSPLQDLGVTTFFQLRIFATGRILLLSNSLAVYSAFENEQSLGNYFLQLIENSRHGAISVNLWPSPPTDNLLIQLQQLKIDHGISISYALGEYVDIFSFTTNQPRHQSHNIYLNHLSHLKRFIIYFRLKSKKILDRKTPEGFSFNTKLGFAKNLSSSSLVDVARFHHKLITSYIGAVLIKIGKKNGLTEKEIDCLAHLLSGKSVRMIADKLEVSSKAVELYLKNIRLKTGLYTKDQLLSVFKVDALIEEF